MKKAGALAVVVVVVCGACGDRPAANPNANTINVPMMPADLGRGDAAPPDEAIEADKARQAEFERMRAERKKFEEEQPPRPTDGDPQNGKWTLDDATAGLAGTGPITATIKTTKGDMKCKLFDDKAPIAVANFVGLARGLRPFRTSRSSGWEKRPVYDGTIFHRVIKGFMIQGGDPLRNGSGEGGYVFADEVWSGAKHDRAGLLCMANRGKNTNGVQFFITDAAAAHLDGGYTIFGECSPLSVVHAIANVPVAGEHPTTDVTITTVEITRAATAATPATPATPTTPTTPKASPPKPKTGDPGF